MILRNENFWLLVCGLKDKLENYSLSTQSIKLRWLYLYSINKLIEYNDIKKSHKLYCVFFLRMTKVWNDESNTHTGVSVVEVAGCCKDCGRDSSDWVLTSPLPWPFTASPFVTGGCCWVKAAFNLWNVNAILRNGSYVICNSNSQNTLCLTQRQYLSKKT